MNLMVRAEGLEPSPTLRSDGFSYHLRLSPSTTKRQKSAPGGLWSGLSLHHGRMAAGAARLVSAPSLRSAPSGLGSGLPFNTVPRIGAVLHHRFPG